MLARACIIVAHKASRRRRRACVWIQLSTASARKAIWKTCITICARDEHHLSGRYRSSTSDRVSIMLNVSTGTTTTPPPVSKQWVGPHTMARAEESAAVVATASSFPSSSSSSSSSSPPSALLARLLFMLSRISDQVIGSKKTGTNNHGIPISLKPYTIAIQHTIRRRATLKCRLLFG